LPFAATAGKVEAMHADTNIPAHGAEAALLQIDQVSAMQGKQSVFERHMAIVSPTVQPDYTSDSTARLIWHVST
jgi:hypothetical protein